MKRVWIKSLLRYRNGGVIVLTDGKTQTNDRFPLKYFREFKQLQLIEQRFNCEALANHLELIDEINKMG